MIVAQSTLAQEPQATIERAEGQTTVRLSGPWTAPHAERVEAVAEAISAEVETYPVVFDLSEIGRLDTLGAWTLNRTRHELSAKGKADFAGASPERSTLLEETAFREFQGDPKPRHSRAVDFLVDVGKSVAGAGKDLVGGVGFLGELVSALLRVIVHPSRFRGTAVINQLEQIAYRGVPIIVLISFLVGCIVSQQGIFQLIKFGATPFVIDLIGILVLRELGVLLTSIMVAGRSGSAFTAEIGSMKMREEIDALRVMGLDPIEVLIVPRIMALVIGLPLLTFIASIAALVGGGADHLGLRRHQPGHLPDAPQGRRQPEHLPGRDHQGAVHGARDRHHRDPRRSRRRGVRRVPRPPRDLFGREGHLHGYRARWTLRHVLRSD